MRDEAIRWLDEAL